MTDKKLFFSLEGIDINDDAALQAFAERVWEQASSEFRNAVLETGDNDDNQETDTRTGESNE